MENASSMYDSLCLGQRHEATTHRDFVHGRVDASHDSDRCWFTAASSSYSPSRPICTSPFRVSILTPMPDATIPAPRPAPSCHPPRRSRHPCPRPQKAPVRSGDRRSRVSPGARHGRPASRHASVAVTRRAIRPHAHAARRGTTGQGELRSHVWTSLGVLRTTETAGGGGERDGGRTSELGLGKGDYLGVLRLASLRASTCCF